MSISEYTKKEKNKLNQFGKDYIHYMENELQKTFIGKIEVPHDVNNVFSQTRRYEELMMMYNCAIREVRTKLEVLNDDLAVRSQRNPIESIKSRIKQPASIVDKMQRNGWELSVDSITKHLNDVAGVRVICAFVDDIFDVSRMLAIQDDIKVIEIKDYIHNPKSNGYRSYHMIVEVPVFFSDRKQPMRVEIQIRTIAMDFWSSLEHELKYKKDLPESQAIIEELRQCAEGIANIDRQMMDIRDRINGDTLKKRVVES